MTMKLSIKNEDAARVARVAVEDFALGKAEPTPTNDFTLEPGESREVYVHAARRVTITEDAHALRPPVAQEKP
jgi:hypothetical protein